MTITNKARNDLIETVRKLDSESRLLVLLHFIDTASDSEYVHIENMVGLYSNIQGD